MRNKKKSKPLVGVLDYGMGNLRSVSKSIEAIGINVTVSHSQRTLSTCDLLVVPGQGAFDSAMKILKKGKLDRFIKNWIQTGRPYLGICLGLQLLFEGSEEAPGQKGLSILKGRVKRFRPKLKNKKVPHMGWNRANVQEMRNGWGSLLKKDSYYYFVHSYYVEPKEKNVVWTKTQYGMPFCSSVAFDNVAATQFHPEKSGGVGNQFLKKVIFKLLKGKKYVNHSSG